jgi:outer membrane protein assembly factor BamD (BamD/ComL family)
VSKDWEIVKKANNLVAYESFISKYPNSSYANESKQKIEEIEYQKENEFWRKIENQNTVQSYKQYLSKYPNGHFVNQAENAIIDLERAKENSSWNIARNTNTISSYKSYLSKYPYGEFRISAEEKIKEIKIQEEEKAWRNANTISDYKKYLKDYPYGKYVNDVEKRIIDLEVDNVFKGSYGFLPPMQKSYSSSNRNTSFNDIYVKNDTEYTLTIRYSGTMSKKVVIPPRGSQKFILSNGSYRIAASVNASNVTPFAGQESLNGGEYSSTFYIQTSTRYGYR